VIKKLFKKKKKKEDQRHISITYYLSFSLYFSASCFISAECQIPIKSAQFFQKKLRFTQIIYISDTIPTNLHIKWQSWDCFAILVHFLTSAEKLSIPQELYIRAANMYSSPFLRIFKHQNNRSKRVLRVNSVFTKFASQRDFDPFWLFRSYLVWREACHSWTRDKMLPDSHRGKILSHIFLSRSDNSFKGRKAKIEECWNEAK